MTIAKKLACLGSFILLYSTVSQALPKVVHTNDGNLDVQSLEYIMALASAGEIELLGIVADAGTGYETQAYQNPLVWEEGRDHYAQIIGKGRRSGLLHIPDAVAGANWALNRPEDGVIEHTIPQNTPGSRLIRDLARQRTPADPLILATGGTLTSIADAYLLDPSIADKVIVTGTTFNTNGMTDYNFQVDAWAAHIICQRFEYWHFPVSNIHAAVDFDRVRNEVPETEIRRFILDKWQNVPYEPSLFDGDGTPAVWIVRPDYLQAVQRKRCEGTVLIQTWGNGYNQAPLFVDDPNGNVRLVTAASMAVATADWHEALSNPAAYGGQIVQQAPYSGQPQAVPGRVEAEHYDWGGPAYAYNDTEFNGWVPHRMTDRPDLESTSDAGGGLNVKQFVAGEWLEYTVHVTSPGLHDFSFRVATPNAGRRLTLHVDGVDLTGAVGIPPTGGWQSWHTLQVSGIPLPSGEHVLRLSTDTGGFNLNYFDVLTSGAECTDGDGDGYSLEGDLCGPADCNDSNTAIHPGAVESCVDNVDNNCDDLIDCEDPDCVEEPECLQCTDSDGDGYSLEGDLCGPADCNDSSAAIHPGAVESCNDAIDNNCNNLIDCDETTCAAAPECQPCTDSDGDGYSLEGGTCGLADCNDSSAAIHPGAAESCSDNVDNDCNSFKDCNDTACACVDLDFFSLVSNQMVSGSYLTHQHVYSTPIAGGPVSPYATFLAAQRGLDAFDVLPNGNVLFSIATDGYVSHAGGTVYLRHHRAYVYNVHMGTITIAAPGLSVLQTLDALARLPDGSIAFSTSANQQVGTLYLRHQNIYRYRAATGTISLLFDGYGLGFNSIDGIDGLTDGRVAFSMVADQAIFTAAGMQYLLHENAYVYDPATGVMTRVFDGDALGITNLDAFALAKRIAIN